MSKNVINEDVVYDLYINQNKEAKEIAEVFGCTIGTIYGLIYRRGWIKRQKIIVDKDVVYDLYITQNLTRKEVAHRLGINELTLKDKLCELGIKKDTVAHVSNTKKTLMKRYGVENNAELDWVREKRKITNLKRYGSESYLQCDDYKEKNKETLEKLGVDNVFQLEEVKQKSRQTCLKKYGAEYYMQNKEAAKKCSEKWANKTPEELSCITKKVNESKVQNSAFKTSKPEQEIKRLLEEKFHEVKWQCQSDQYPFLCDFYIPKLDLYIEYQGFWIHGFKPFEGTSDDLKKLESWKRLAEKSDFYRNAISVWTKKDVEKRETAKKNNLNFIEFFTFNEFMGWYEKQ